MVYTFSIKQKVRLSYKLGPLLQLIRQNMKDATSEARGFTLLSISLWQIDILGQEVAPKPWNVLLYIITVVLRDYFARSEWESVDPNWSLWKSWQDIEGADIQLAVTNVQGTSIICGGCHEKEALGKKLMLLYWLQRNQWWLRIRKPLTNGSDSIVKKQQTIHDSVPKVNLNQYLWMQYKRPIHGLDWLKIVALKRAL